MTEPGFWDDPDKARQITIEVNDLKGWIEPWEAARDRAAELTELAELLEAEPDGDAQEDADQEPEGVALEIAGQTHPRRQHDVGVRSARLEPGQPELAEVAGIDHGAAPSSSRIWSRSCAARSNSSRSTATSSFRLSRVSCSVRSAVLESGGR